MQQVKESARLPRVQNLSLEDVGSSSVRRKDGKGKPSKPRPNYFVAVQVDNPEIHKALQNIQESLVDNAPLMKRALVSISTLHITFVVMHVAQEEDLKRAEEALVASYDSIKEDLNESPLILTFEGLSNFKKQVLFAELRMDDSYGRIINMYKKIASCFESHGFDVREKDKFTPHLTVAKLSKDPRLRKKGLKQISPAWYEDFENDMFGEQLVKSLQLLKMEKASNGYYPCDRECFFGAEWPSSEPQVPLEKKLLFLSEKKKEVRKKIFDLTTEKLAQKEQK